MCTIIEIKGDIRTAPQGYSIAAAFSDDLNCNVGIPKIMDEMFNIVDRIEAIKRYKKTDAIAKLDNLYLLFVKESSYDTPIYNRMVIALKELRKRCEKDCIKKLAMPKICTGSGGFDWEKVNDAIMDAFMLTDIDIVIYCR